MLPPAYWIWAGLTARDAPPDTDLYVYQGLISDGSTASYQRLGLYPHPIKARHLFLVYRLEGTLPDAARVKSIFDDSVRQWQRHGVAVAGMQLDFDAPTSQLLPYSDFLKNMRAQLPAAYSLSITGLGDWAMRGEPGAMQSIASATDDIVFQLYQSWRPLPGILDYIDVLEHYPLPFRIGLLASDSGKDYYILRLRTNPNFRGVIYFIQRVP